MGRTTVQVGIQNTSNLWKSVSIFYGKTSKTLSGNTESFSLYQDVFQVFTEPFT